MVVGNFSMVCLWFFGCLKLNLLVEWRGKFDVATFFQKFGEGLYFSFLGGNEVSERVEASMYCKCFSFLIIHFDF